LTQHRFSGAHWVEPVWIAEILVGSDSSEPVEYDPLSSFWVVCQHLHDKVVPSTRFNLTQLKCPLPKPSKS